MSKTWQILLLISCLCMLNLACKEKNCSICGTEKGRECEEFCNENCERTQSRFRRQTRVQNRDSKDDSDSEESEELEPDYYDNPQITKEESNESDYYDDLEKEHRASMKSTKVNSKKRQKVRGGGFSRRQKQRGLGGAAKIERKGSDQTSGVGGPKKLRIKNKGRGRARQLRVLEPPVEVVSRETKMKQCCQENILVIGGCNQYCTVDLNNAKVVQMVADLFCPESSYKMLFSCLADFQDRTPCCQSIPHGCQQLCNPKNINFVLNVWTGLLCQQHFNTVLECIYT